MRRPGWDTRCRNRYLGTAKSGHGQDNYLTIPESWASDRLFYEKLVKPITWLYEIKGNSLTLLVEKV
ncbi:MAG: hypothetical protein AAGE59_20950 [Cyanobacteria bacterium P01_F01_bin.86]